MNLESVEELREHKENSKTVALIRFFLSLQITSEPLLIPFIHAFMASITLNAKGSVILDDGFPPFISFTNLHYKHLISSQPLCNQSPLPF